MRSTMLLFSQNSVLLVLLSALISPTHAQREEKLIYTFSYQFFENAVQNAPSRTEFNELICLHDEYFTQVYKMNSGNEAVLFQSTNIGWEFDKSLLNEPDSKPLDVFLAANVTTTDGSEPPTLNAMAQYFFDPWEFVPNYLHAKSDAGSVWKSVSGMSHEWEIAVPRRGKLPKSVCDGSQDGNAGGVTRPPRGEQNTPAPTPAAVATEEIPKTAMTAIEFKFLEGSSREPTLEELDDLMCNADEFFTKWMQDESGDPSANVKGAVVQHFLNSDQTVWVMIAQSITAQRSQLGPDFVVMAVNGFNRGKVIDFVKNYAWQTPQGSVFKDTTSVSFTALVSDDPQLVGLDPTCGSMDVEPPEEEDPAQSAADETSAPTLAPSIATAPPTVTATTQAPTSPPTLASPEPTTSPTVPPSVGVQETSAPTTSPTVTEATQEPTILPTAAVVDTTATTPGPTTSTETTDAPVTDTRGPVFVLDFGLQEGQEVRAPTQAEVEDLICHTDRFFQERMHNLTGDTTIESYATMIDWQVNDNNNPTQPIQITFLSNSVMEGAPVPPSLVTYVMAVNEEDLVFYIENFVWQTAPDSIFQYVTSVEFTDYIEGGPTLGTLERASCQSEPTAAPSNNDTPAPTTTATSAETGNPTLQPTAPDATPRPTSGVQPTKQPTTNPDTDAPTREPATNPDTGNSDTEAPTREPATNPGTEQPTNQPPPGSSGSGGQGPTTNESPNGTGTTTPAISPSMVPTTVAPRPTQAPVVQPQPEVIPPSQFRSTGIFPVRPEFLISNLDGLTDENTIRFSSGLDLAWSTFATEIVENVTKHWRTSGSRRLEDHNPLLLRHRGLSIERVPNSAKINGVSKIDCDKNAHLEATCLWIEAEYQYNIVKERYFFLNQLFVNSTNEALRNGTFQYILQRVSPSTPLVVGAIPREANREYATSDGGSSSGGDGGGGKGGMSGAGKFFLTLFILILIFVPIGYYFWKKKQDSKPNLPPYQEEGFVYDFVLPKGVELQTEVDDPGAKGLLVEAAPFGSSTDSSENAPIDGFEYDTSGYNEYANDELGDTDDDWDGEDPNEQHHARSAESNDDDSFESASSYDPAGGDYSTNNEQSDVNDHYHDEDGHGQYSDDDEEAPLVRAANVTRGHDEEERDGAPWDDEDSGYEGGTSVQRKGGGHARWDDEDSGYEGGTSVQRQGGGQESLQGSGVWSGYDDHLKGLKGIGDSQRGEEESISFGGEDNEEEDSMDDEMVQRQYGDEMVADMMGGAAHDTSYVSRSSMESESGWEDTSGASSREEGEWRESSSDEEDRWA